MSKKLRVFLAFLLISPFMVAPWIVPLREPRYAGRSLTIWLLEYDAWREEPPKYPELQLPDPGMPEAYEAIRRIGTNGIPTLLRMLQSPDTPALKRRLLALAAKYGFYHRPPYHDPCYPGDLQLYHDPRDPEDRRFLARVGFGVLGPDAAGAVPAMIQIYRQDPSGKKGQAALFCLGAIGPSARQAIPLFMSALSTTDPVARDRALLALRGIHAEPELVMPTLLKLLHDPNDSVRRDALCVLADYSDYAGPGAEPGLTVRELANSLRDGDVVVRAEAARTVGKWRAHIKTRAQVELIVPELVKGLSGRDVEIAARPAALALGEFGADAEPALPGLVNLLDDRFDELPFPSFDPDIAGAIFRIAGDLPAPRLLRLLYNTNSCLIRMLALDSLATACQRNQSQAPGGALDPQTVLPQVARLLDDPDARVRWHAARALEPFGTNAAPAIPKLRGLLMDDDARVREQATNTLQRIAVH